MGRGDELTRLRLEQAVAKLAIPLLPGQPFLHRQEHRRPRLLRAELAVGRTVEGQALVQGTEELVDGELHGLRLEAVDAIEAAVPEVDGLGRQGRLAQAGQPLHHRHRRTPAEQPLEALRIDVMQGAAERAWPEIASRLDEVRAWWQRTRGGEPVPEAPDPLFLGRALVSALNIAHQANQALELWQASLDLLAESEETKRTLGEGEHERAITRFNQYGPLLRLGLFDDAQRVLEGCLHVFREADDVTALASVLSALADLWNVRGDRDQAVALERQALAVSDRLPDLAYRSISHGNLTNYLDRSEETEEAARHLLAAIVYDLVTNHRQFLATDLNNLGNRMRRAAPDPYELPRLADLLSRPEFDALKHVLEASGVDAGGLQGAIDEIVEQVRQQVESLGGKGKPEEK